jgi:predicted transcriptional regulator
MRVKLMIDIHRIQRIHDKVITVGIFEGFGGTYHDFCLSFLSYMRIKSEISFRLLYIRKARDIVIEKSITLWKIDGNLVIRRINLMKKDDIRRLLFVLGKEHCLDVMINLNKNGWQTASEVARDLNIHIATAVKYLSELFELDFVDRRVKRGKTRKAFEYRVKDPKVTIEFDLSALKSKPIGSGEKPLVLFSILFTILMKSRKVVGNSVDSHINGKFMAFENNEKDIVKNSLMFDGDLEDAKNFFQNNIENLGLSDTQNEEVVCILIELINIVLEHYESRLGPHSTKSLVDVTMYKVFNIFEPKVMDYSTVLDVLPNDYFGKWVS